MIQLRFTDPRRDDLLGPAARPVLIKVISQLRPELDPISVGGAVERIVLNNEEGGEIDALWKEINEALIDLEKS